ncbi:hypothetical protein PFFCH_01642 [Plasmodium falciparum FCH/4]|uniref:Surface antigen n=1 Tax=Plasmodium falciparum FCH/4 TaxID=1036724 RepID=A0A024VRV3_PLAFA|nr:hypothetical protein PFFCH_01642 [Plasmodium falciparum FCH/4]
MKVHYINVLLLALPLNILEYNQRNHKSATFHTSNTKPTKTHRTLCECESYAPSNYENDPEMKFVMENFDRQSSQRFREYDERMQNTRQKCKDKCDKEIEKIILKDKLEKQLAQQFSTLQINIDANDIPTCVCEKSMADKTEKVCLNCGKTMGAVAPAWGFVSGIGYVAWTQYIPIAVANSGIQKGIEVGVPTAIDIIKISLKGQFEVPKIDFIKMITHLNGNNKVSLVGIIKDINSAMCGVNEIEERSGFCFMTERLARNTASLTRTYSTQIEAVTKAVSDAEKIALTKAYNVTNSLYTAITASIIAIVVIVLVMVIIYLILRYRRKKKMKKKLQYIKLLKE